MERVKFVVQRKNPVEMEWPRIFERHPQIIDVWIKAQQIGACRSGDPRQTQIGAMLFPERLCEIRRADDVAQRPGLYYEIVHVK